MRRWPKYGENQHERTVKAVHVLCDGRLFQEHDLPTTFNFDKRKAHFSSLIVSEQMTRSAALELFEKPLYDPHELEMDIEFVCKNLDLTRDEFDEIMGRAPRDRIMTGCFAEATRRRS